MIPVIKQYIYEHIDNWPIKIQQPLLLRPLFLSNINYNFVEDYPLITRVVLWFDKQDKYPSIATKIVDKSLTLKSIEECRAFQKKINDEIGYKLFPAIFDIAEIAGNIVLFEEAVKSSTYETELKYAICAPERSLPRFERVIQRQFQEMGRLFKKLQGIRTSDWPQRWGDWAFKLGQDFRKTCGFNAKSLTDASLDKMRKAIDSVPLYQTPVLADLVCPNIFSGPMLIDNITLNIDELNIHLPGVINVFRFIIPYFYSPPVKNIFQDWLYAIAVAITDKEDKTIIGSPVRNILKESGLDPDRPDIIWAFVMVATLFEMKDKLEFYRRSPFMIGQKKEEFYQYTKELINIQKLIDRNRKFDIGSVLSAQDSLRIQELSAGSKLSKRIILKLFPSFMRPGLTKLYKLLYPKIDSIPYLKRIKKNLMKKLYNS